MPLSTSRMRFVLLALSLLLITVAYVVVSRAAPKWIGSRSFPRGAEDAAMFLTFEESSAGSVLAAIRGTVRLPSGILITLSPPVMRVTDSGTLEVAFVPFSREAFALRGKSKEKYKQPKPTKYTVAVVAPKGAIEVNPDAPVEDEITEQNPGFDSSWSLSPKKVGIHEIQLKGLPASLLETEPVVGFVEQATPQRKAMNK